MPTESPPMTLGTPAPDFSLPSTTGATVALSDFAAQPVLVVAFICNHCPYVRHIESQLGRVLADYQDRGVAAVGISANDVDGYPDDDVPHLAEQAERAGFGFPYLYDETQDVARSYGAVCTPDLFVFDADRRLAYRGEFDSSRPEQRRCGDRGIVAGGARPRAGRTARAAAAPAECRLFDQVAMPGDRPPDR